MEHESYKNITLGTLTISYVGSQSGSDGMHCHGIASFPGSPEREMYMHAQVLVLVSSYQHAATLVVAATG